MRGGRADRSQHHEIQTQRLGLRKLGRIVAGRGHADAAIPDITIQLPLGQPHQQCCTQMDANAQFARKLDLLHLPAIDQQLRATRT